MELIPDLAPDSAISGHPGETLPTAIRIRAIATNGGGGVPAAKVEWTTAGAGSAVQAAANHTDANGYASANWLLGTKSSDQQGLTIRVSTESHAAQIAYRATAVPYVVKKVHLQPTGPDTVRLSDSVRYALQAEDPFGNLFPAPHPRFVSMDTTTIKVDTLGRARLLKRGGTSVIGASGTLADTMPLRVIQVVHQIVTALDTFRFHAIGQVASDSVKLIDDRGLAVKDSTPQVRLVDTTIVRLLQPYPITLRSSANGFTAVRLQAGTVAKDLGVAVAQQATSIQVVEPSITFNAVGDTLRLTATVVDSLGVPLTSPQVTFASTDSTTASVNVSGLVRSRRNGVALLLVRANTGVTDTVPVTVNQAVAAVVIPRDSIAFDALNAATALGATALDRLGSPVAGSSLTYGSADSAIASVGTDGVVHARANGRTLVVARANGDSALAVISVTQRAVRVLVPSDTMKFVALGETQTVTGVAVDSLGSRVAGTVGGVTIMDTTVVAKIDSTTVRSRSNGVTDVQFSMNSLLAHVTIVVQQVPDTVIATLNYPQRIVTLPADTLLPVSCTVLDRNQFTITGLQPAVTTPAGTVIGTTCSGLQMSHSGLDTLRIRAGSHETRLPVVLAVRPTVSSSIGDLLQFDSLPSGRVPWAPTARRNSRGQLEIYFAAFPLVETTWDEIRSDLHRLVSSDGLHWTYDGVVLQHDDSLCTLNGSGIENVSIVPRADGPGWRMFYSSGSFPCYGWQVFSAVSTDERTWVKEPGVRLTNGGTVPPDSAVYAPWPVGEGMMTEHLPSGAWRMIVGGFEHILPYENKFQLIEWRSPDQLNWSYVGPLFTSRDMPPPGQGTVYSPNIRQIAPGLWRMIFNGDNRYEQNWRGGIWSAVSTDEQSWQLEGELMGGDQTRLWYGSLVDNYLVLIRQDFGDQRRLAIATITMP